MEFTREINHLLFGTLLAFFIVAGSAGYWAVTGEDSILERDDNPRTVEDEVAIRRGSIYTRDDKLLVESVVNASIVERLYHEESFNSAVGYFSFRYGVSGVEAAYDDILRGDTLIETLETHFEREVLHRPHVGSDIRLTFNSEVQETVIREMGEKQGAVIVMEVPSGEILSLVSLPTYDPNTLDEQWESLIEADGEPFFNRVLQGQYQSGGILQTPLMIASILTNQSFDTTTTDANSQITVNEVIVQCAIETSEIEQTIRQAYAYGCPRPFAQLIQQINATTLQNIIESFHLDTPPALLDFEDSNIATSNPEAEITPEATPEVNEENLVTDLLGQGQITINPLSMVALTSAIINEGNAPQPYALKAIREPEGDWVARTSPQATTALITAEAASRIRDLMIANVEIYEAEGLIQPNNLMMGSHLAVALSGEETQTWFIGFVLFEDGRGVAIAVVVEDTSNIEDTAFLGNQILNSAHKYLQKSAE